MMTERGAKSLKKILKKIDEDLAGTNQASAQFKNDYPELYATAMAVVQAIVNKGKARGNAGDIYARFAAIIQDEIKKKTGLSENLDLANAQASLQASHAEMILKEIGKVWDDLGEQLDRIESAVGADRFVAGSRGSSPSVAPLAEMRKSKR